MADNELEIAGLRDDYYRDSFGKLMLIMSAMILAIVLLLLTSFYLYISVPPPVTFPVYKEWRVQPDVPLAQPYLETPILLQWVSDTLLSSIHFDFENYNEQLQAAQHNFTEDGWRVFVDQLNNYANPTEILSKKMFISSTPDSAPILLNPGGVLEGRYAWWVQAPITINYIGNEARTSRTLTLQVLVVRVPTLNNLMGVGIDNIIVAQGAGIKAGGGNL
jgi:intracellular multiplication protein IcmL